MLRKNNKKKKKESGLLSKYWMLCLLCVGWMSDIFICINYWPSENSGDIFSAISFPKKTHQKKPSMQIKIIETVNKKSTKISYLLFVLLKLKWFFLLLTDCFMQSSVWLIFLLSKLKDIKLETFFFCVV